MRALSCLWYQLLQEQPRQNAYDKQMQAFLELIVLVLNRKALLQQYLTTCLLPHRATPCPAAAKLLLVDGLQPYTDAHGDVS